MHKLKIRLITCWYILTRKYNNWVIINVDKKNLIKIVSDKKNFEGDMQYHGLQPYIISRMIKMMANAKDETEMICDKAKFEADAEMYKSKK
jgi:hypothetical protein